MSAKLDLTRAGNTLSFPWPKASHWSDAESMFAAEAEAAGRDWSSAWSNVLCGFADCRLPAIPADVSDGLVGIRRPTTPT